MKRGARGAQVEVSSHSSRPEFVSDEASWMNNGDPRTKPSCVACGSGETWEYDRDAKLAG